MKKVITLLAVCLLSFGYAWADPEMYAVFSSDKKTLTFYMGNRDDNPDHIFSWTAAKSNYTADIKKVEKIVFDYSLYQYRAYQTQTNMSHFFEGFENLTEFVNFDYFNTGIIQNFSYMFKDCKKLQYVDDASFDMQNARNINSMFENCSSLKSIDASNWGFQHEYTANSIFSGCTSLQYVTGDVMHWSTDGRYAFQNCSSLEWVKLGNPSKLVMANHMFDGCSSLKTIYCERNLVEAVKENSYEMFRGCTQLCGDNSTCFNSSKINNEYATVDGGPKYPGYFSRGRKVYAKKSDDGKKVTFYFAPCTEEQYWETGDYSFGANVTTVKFDATMNGAYPTSTYDWFYGFSELTTIERIEWLHTDAVTDMGSMFNSCSSLTSLDLSTFVMDKVENVGGMFFGCSNLRTIYCDKDWSVLNMDDEEMFDECYLLKGGAGTPWDANHTDKTYARPDGGASRPGYFTPFGEGVENVQSDKVQSTKVIRDGMLFIERNGKTYNAQGAEVK